MLSVLQEKLSFISMLGADFVYLEEFDEVKDFSPSEFVDMICEKFGAECTFCGENFTFGKMALGTEQTLLSLMEEKGKKSVTVQTLKVDGNTVSSTEIRRFLPDGDVEKAAMLLGRSYTVTAPVIGGRRLGRELGFPTINQHFFEGAAVPRRGVYAAAGSVDGKEYPAVTNVGVRPTVSGGSDVVTAETHIIGYSGDLYGRVLTVELLRFMRPERTFGGREELTAAVLADIKSAEKYYSENIAK
jgi:riboflavin kinase/FMN adenylyltransferase